MAIVEDEVRNESEDENDVDVPPGGPEGGQQDSDDSEDDDDAVDAALESKVAELEEVLKDDSYSYDDHLELVKAYWALSDLERWRAAFDRFAGLLALRPEDWLQRLRTEISLCHAPEDRERIADLFQNALLDSYSVEVLSEWCEWSLSAETAAETRAQLRKIVHIVGADPLSGKLFWDALYEFEKAQLEAFSAEERSSEAYSRQTERVCRCLEEAVSRPLQRARAAWPLYEQSARAAPGYPPPYVATTLKHHEIAMAFLDKITPFEDRLLAAENDIEEKAKIYEEYIEELEVLCDEDNGGDSRDFIDTFKVVLDRAWSCGGGAGRRSRWLRRWTELADRRAEREGGARELRAAARRQPRTHHYHAALMQLAESSRQPVQEVHAVFEAALLRGMETYKEGELLWLSYIEYKRRQTDFDKEEDVERLRSTFRLAWDSLANCYGEEANDCEVPLYWARIEYQRIKAPKEGREIFDEIFRYGSNKTMSKYWEALLRLEAARSPAPAPGRLRELFRRALAAVRDYPPAVAALYRAYERDYGDLASAQACARLLEKRLEEWRDSYKKMKESMAGKKHNKNNDYKKNKSDNRNKQGAKQQDVKNKPTQEKSKDVGKRKFDGGEGTSGVKKKRESAMEVDVPEEASTSQGVKRSHGSNEEEIDCKKPRTETEEDGTLDREACTLFVSNLEFKVNEESLRDKLSEYGDIASLRVKAGVKAFGGSICYCQYTTAEAVSRALKHDRAPLGGRPMFLSRYSAQKGKPHFKYATAPETNKLFLKNLPYSLTKQQLSDVFQPYGELDDVRIVTHKDGKPRGLAYVVFKSAEAAAAALSGTQGLELGGRRLDAAVSAPPPRGSEPRAQHSAPATMRRTKLSSFVPSVLLKGTPMASKVTAAGAEPAPSSSTAADANNDGKPKSNSYFRDLLTKKQ